MDVFVSFIVHLGETFLVLGTRVGAPGSRERRCHQGLLVRWHASELARRIEISPLPDVGDRPR